MKDTLHNGDFLNLSKKLEDNSIDLAVCDPPYNLSKGGKWKWDKSKKLPGFGGEWNKVMQNWDDMSFAEYTEFTIAWLKEVKSPKTTIDTAISTSAEIIKRIPDFPEFIDKANYALQLMAEGKLNLVTGINKNLEIEQMRLKNFRNNLFIGFLGIVILSLLVF